MASFIWPSKKTGPITNADIADNADISRSKLDLAAPTVQKFTSGSGTYTTPAGVLYIRVEMVGGGGGGQGSSTSAWASNSATVGGNTTFGTSLLVANGGGLGYVNGGVANGFSLGTGPVGYGRPGIPGQNGGYKTAAGALSLGGGGGTGAGRALFSAGGEAAIANSGGGGGGAGLGDSTAGWLGAGGASGSYVNAIITSPASTYSYAVGAGGSGGSAGTSGNAGGAGGSGIIIVTEYYQ